jgi:hypothetical protein
MYASPASLLLLPHPRRRVTRGENAPAGVFFALAGRYAQFGAFFPFRGHSYEHEIKAINNSLD